METPRALYSSAKPRWCEHNSQPPLVKINGLISHLLQGNWSYHLRCGNLSSCVHLHVWLSLETGKQKFPELSLRHVGPSYPSLGVLSNKCVHNSFHWVQLQPGGLSTSANQTPRWVPRKQRTHNYWPPVRSLISKISFASHSAIHYSTLIQPQRKSKSCLTEAGVLQKK